jgi:hypothetical protein
LNSFGINNIIIGLLLFMALEVIFFSSLVTEISFEPQYSEMIIPSGENFTYGIYIKNIGVGIVNVSCSVVGINQMGMCFHPQSVQIKRGDTESMNVSIDTVKAFPGDYQGLVYVQNDNNQEILEKIPITVKVKRSYRNSSERANQTYWDQKPLSLCV